MRKRKILHIYKDYFPVLGGIENHIRLLCTELAKDNNFEIVVLVTNTDFKTTVEKIDGVRVIKASRLYNFASTPISLTLFTWISKLKSDIIHLHFPYPLGELSALLSSNHSKMVLTYHGDIVRQKKLLLFYKSFLRKVLCKVDLIIATNPNYLMSSEYLSPYLNKVQIIPFGIDLCRFQSRDLETISEIKKKLEPPLILFVGKLRYYKGLRYLIKAARQVEANFLIIGEGPCKKELQYLIKEYNLSNKIHLLGEVSDENLPSYYQASDIFVLPSSHPSEAFGISLLEAMACGVPAISTDLGTGTTFVNLHNQTGFVVPPCDSQALANALNHLLLNKELRLKFGESARKRAEEMFSKELMTKRIKSLYYKLMD